MEATALSVGKSVLDGALCYVQSAIAEEVALQLGVQRDHAFIRDELEMMLAFLLAAHDSKDNHKVLMTWVKQVRDVAYDAEDCLQDFSIHLHRQSWWRLPSTLWERRRIAMQMKELRARVEDVSQRNLRYQLFKSGDDYSMPETRVAHSSLASVTMSGVEEARPLENKAKVDLIRLVTRKDQKLRVIGVWGTTGAFEETSSIIRRAYDDLKRNKRFECHAWIRIMHPFNSRKFLQSIVRQFFVHSLEEATDQVHEKSNLDLRSMATMKECHLVCLFKKYVSQKSYLIVLTGLTTIEEWNQIKAYFPINKKWSRLVVCTEHAEVASLCVGPETEMPEHKQLSIDPTLYAFYKKGSQGGTDSIEQPGPAGSDIEVVDSTKGGKISARRRQL